MRRAVCVGMSAMLLLMSALSFADETEEVKIKYGMHKNKIEQTLGEPVAIEKLKNTFFLTKNKALYLMHESSYVLIRYIASRVNKVTVLDGVKSTEALSFFEEEFN